MGTITFACRNKICCDVIFISALWMQALTMESDQIFGFTMKFNQV